MALITCPDCGKDVSDIAPTCPACGRPIPAAGREPMPFITKFLWLLVVVACLSVGGYFLTNRQGKTVEIGQQVAQLLQQQLEKAPLAQYHMKAGRVQVMHIEGNKYQGFADIDYHGVTHQVPVDILYDGDYVSMQVQSGGFVFIAQDALQNLAPGSAN